VGAHGALAWGQYRKCAACPESLPTTQAGGVHARGRGYVPLHARSLLWRAQMFMAAHCCCCCCCCCCPMRSCLALGPHTLMCVLLLLHRRVYLAAHYLSLANTAKSANQGELAARQLTSALRYCGIIPADKVCTCRHSYTHRRHASKASTREGPAYLRHQPCRQGSNLGLQAHMPAHAHKHTNPRRHP